MTGTDIAYMMMSLVVLIAMFTIGSAMLRDIKDMKRKRHKRESEIKRHKEYKQSLRNRKMSA